jgi:uncharacterized protein YndB with AHSA1/START domain
MTEPRDAAVVEVRVRIAARPATVFSFFADPERFRAWMGKGSTLTAAVGGVLAVAYPNGDLARGEVVELDPGRRVVLTWGYEDARHGLAPGSTRVTIELTPIETGTLVTLRHDGLPTPEQRRAHLAGWRHYLAGLAAAAASTQLDGAVEGAVDRWIAAWRSADGAARAAALAACVEDDVLFRDAMGYVEGRAALDDHIVNAQRFAPGVRLERAGAIARAHDCVTYPWRMVGPDGRALMAGTNFGRLSPDGRFREVVGFWAAGG